MKIFEIYIFYLLFSVFCPTFSRRDKLLKWASSRLPLTWSTQSRTLSGGINDLWSDGSLLCTLINTAIPGACPDPHRHWKKSPTHAQAIAYKYFGLAPVSTALHRSQDRIYCIWAEHDSSCCPLNLNSVSLTLSLSLPLSLSL